MTSVLPTWPQRVVWIVLSHASDWVLYLQVWTAWVWCMVLRTCHGSIGCLTSPYGADLTYAVLLIAQTVITHFPREISPGVKTEWVESQVWAEQG